MGRWQSRAAAANWAMQTGKHVADDLENDDAHAESGWSKILQIMVGELA